MVKTLFWYLQLILNKKDDFLLFHGLFYKNNPKKKNVWGGGLFKRHTNKKKAQYAYTKSGWRSPKTSQAELEIS